VFCKKGLLRRIREIRREATQILTSHQMNSQKEVVKMKILRKIMRVLIKREIPSNKENPKRI